MFIYVIGINQCTRALERAYKQQCQCKKNDMNPNDSAEAIPSLIILSRDVRPATIAHIVVYAKRLNIPTLILPGKASTEFGKALGIHSVSVAVFLSSSDNKCGEHNDDKQKEKEWKEAHNDVDSFVKYVISKIPST